MHRFMAKKIFFGLPWEPATPGKSEPAPSPEFSELKLPEKPTITIKKPKENFIDVLEISVNGIITSSNEENNACIVSESSGKEKMYKAGDSILDGLVMNIARNSVSIVRPNGQVETFRVGTSEIPGKPQEIGQIVTKLDDNNFSIDHLRFSRELSSVGELVERFGIMPEYKDGTCTGLQITKVEPEDITQLMGFEEDDLLLSVSGIPVSNAQDRINAYDKVTNLKYGDTLDIELERGSEKLAFNYKFEKHKMKIKSLAERLGMEPSEDGQATDDSTKKTDSAVTKKSELDKKTSSFTKPAEDKERYSSNINMIRKRLFDNARKQTSHLR